MYSKWCNLCHESDDGSATGLCVLVRLDSGFYLQRVPAAVSLGSDDDEDEESVWILQYSTTQTVKHKAPKMLDNVQERKCE